MRPFLETSYYTFSFIRNLQDIESDAPILHKSAVLYKELYQALKLFPKKDQYLLGKRCEEHILSFIEYILVAVTLPKERKLKALESANGKFEVLKVLLRIARDLKILDTKRYLSLEVKIQEIGRMLGGWMRSFATKTP